MKMRTFTRTFARRRSSRWCDMSGSLIKTACVRAGVDGRFSLTRDVADGFVRRFDAT